MKTDNVVSPLIVLEGTYDKTQLFSRAFYDIDPAVSETDFFLQDRQTKLDDEVNAQPKPGQAPRNFEDVVRALGTPGRYQIVHCLLQTANFIPVVFVHMHFVFTGFEPPFSCSLINETTFFHEHPNLANVTHQIAYDDCEIRIISNTSGTHEDVDTFGCSEGYTYKGGKHVSIITEWDLVCDKRGIAEMTQTLLSLGWFVGTFFTSALSDKFGRKKTIAISAGVCSLCEISCVFAPSVYLMMGFRFFSGFFCSGTSSASFVLGSEILLSKHRVIFGVYSSIVWAIFSTSVCAIAYIFRENSWRDLHLCLALICMSPVLFMFFVDESASWLYSQGDYQKASRIIQKACRVNGIDYNTVKPTWDDLCAQGIKHDTDTKSAKDYNVLDLFRNNKLRASVLIAWIAACSNDIAYFGMHLGASTLAGNFYLNTSLMAMLELPGCVWLWFMLKYKGRRFVIMFFMAMAAVCLLVSTCLSSAVTNYTQHIANTSTAFFLLGKLAISNSYSTIYLYIPELFPTTLRSSGMGMSMSGGSFGGMLSPYFVQLHHIARWAPGTCLVGALTITTVLMLKLPETKGKQLKSSIQGQSYDI